MITPWLKVTHGCQIIMCPKWKDQQICQNKISLLLTSVIQSSCQCRSFETHNKGKPIKSSSIAHCCIHRYYNYTWSHHHQQLLLWLDTRSDCLRMWPPVCRRGWIYLIIPSFARCASEARLKDQESAQKSKWPVAKA